MVTTKFYIRYDHPFYVVVKETTRPSKSGYGKYTESADVKTFNTSLDAKAYIETWREDEKPIEIFKRVKYIRAGE